MSTVPYSTGAFIDMMVEFLDTTTTMAGKEIGIGDGIRPDGYGWSGGQPGKGTYVPYVVLDFSAAGSANTDTLRDDQGDWDQTVLITGFGGNRQQANWSTDTIRGLLDPWRPTVPGWRVLNVRYTSLGGPARDDATDPATWKVVDALTLRITRANS